MRYLSIAIVLVFFTTVLSASHFRSIRVGSFYNKIDAEKSLVKLNKYIETQKNIIYFQKKLFFKAKAIKVGRYYMNVIEPFGDNQKELQEIVDTIRKKYPHAYIKKIQGKMPIQHKSMKKLKPKPKQKEIKAKSTPPKIEEVLKPIIEKVAEPIVVQKVKNQALSVIPTPIVEELVVEKNVKEENKTIMEDKEVVEPIIREDVVEEIVIDNLQENKVIEDNKPALATAVVEVQEVNNSRLETAVIEVEEQNNSELETAVVEIKEENKTKETTDVVAVEEQNNSEKEVAVVKVKAVVEVEPVAEVEEKKVEAQQGVEEYINKIPTELQIVIVVLVGFVLILFIIVLFLLKKVSNLKKINISTVDNVAVEQLEKLTALENQIEALKIANEQHIMQLNATHQTEIATVEDSYNRRIGAMNLKNENSLNDLLLNHQNDLEELVISNQDKIEKIKAIYETKIEKINDENIKKIDELKVEKVVETPNISEKPIIEEKIVPIETVKVAEDIEELTIFVGLGNCDDDALFYRSILEEFKSKYSNSPETFEEFYSNNSLEDAKYLAREIKDLSVNIGAYGLSERLASIEFECEKGSNNGWQELVATYRANLERLIIEIDDYTNKN